MFAVFVKLPPVAILFISPISTVLVTVADIGGQHTLPNPTLKLIAAALADVIKHIGFNVSRC